MTGYAVLIAPDGRVVMANKPQLNWHPLPFVLPNWDNGKSEIKQIDNRSFMFQDSGGLQRIGRFVLARNGGLNLKFSAVLPQPTESVIAVSPSGQQILVESEPFVFHLLSEKNGRWIRIAHDLDILKGAGNVNRVIARFSTDENYICVGLSSRLLINSNISRLHVYSIHHNTFRRLASICPTGEIGLIVPFDKGWYVSAGADNVTLTYTLMHSLKQMEKHALQRYGSGGIVAPSTKNGAVLYDSFKSVLSLNGKVVGEVPREYAAAPSSEIYYWPGVGAICLPVGGKTLWINNHPHKSPFLPVQEQLYFVT